MENSGSELRGENCHIKWKTAIKLCQPKRINYNQSTALRLQFTGNTKNNLKLLNSIAVTQ